MDNVMTETSTPPDNDAKPRTVASDANRAPKRLYRDPYGTIGGVASGMAGYFGVDPVLVRLLWLVALISGVGFFAYLVFWVVVPKARVWPPPGYPDTLTGGESRKGLGGTIVSGLFIVGLSAIIGSKLDGIGDLVLPVALVGFGIYLLNQRGALEAEMWAAPTETAPAAPFVPGPANIASAWEPPGVATPLVLSLLALGGGGAWALHSFGVVSLSISALSAAALVVIGGGLLASLWLGPARGLMPLGVACAALLLVSSAVEPWWNDSSKDWHAALADGRDVGQQTYRPLSIAELEDNYEVGVGELTLDLSALELDGTTRDVHIEVGIGKLSVIAPQGVSLEIKGEVGVGKASALDVESEGLGREVEKTEAGTKAGQLNIDFEVGIGEGKVRRGS
jgi:phage shock protein PspC (stress-responsive transcriptional regulator)